LPGIKPLYHKNAKYVADNEKAMQAAACSKFTNVINGSGGCIFGSFLGIKRTPMFDWLNAATGWNKTPEEYLAIGERIQTTKQAFNVKHGIDPRTYKTHDRTAGIPPLTEGANKGRTVAIEKMMKDYWSQFGWDANTGKPTAQTMAKFGL
jgi:aldehyde:ferredoxin oxidoreductase